MKKAARFILIVLFLLSFAPGCKTMDKVVVDEPLKEVEKIAPSVFSITYDFKLKDLSGSEVSLSSFKDKKAVVLVFWTTWCPYCRQALKSLQADFKSLRDLGAELLAINVGESPYQVNKFVQTFNPSFQVLLDQDSSVADHYDLLGVPTYVIINKSGQVVYNGNTFSKEKLRELSVK